MKKTKEQLLLEIKRDTHWTANICQKIMTHKLENKELRFGQILLNALGDRDLYNIEDDDLSDLLEEKYEE